MSTAVTALFGSLAVVVTLAAADPRVQDTAAARRAYDQAVALQAEGNDAAALVSLAKAKANQTFFLCGNEGVQMHGGIGMTDEHEIGFFTKRARVAMATFGSTAFHQDRYARLMGY